MPTSTPTAKFSVKSTMYPTTGSRGRSVDGPWKPTIEGAVLAFAESLKKKGLSDKMVFNPFLAEECPKEIAPSGDGKRYYKGRPDLQTQLRTLLAGSGVSL